MTCHLNLKEVVRILNYALISNSELISIRSGTENLGLMIGMKHALIMKLYYEKVSKVFQINFF